MPDGGVVIKASQCEAFFFARLLNSKEKACKVRPAVSHQQGFSSLGRNLK